MEADLSIPTPPSHCQDVEFPELKLQKLSIKLEVIHKNRKLRWGRETI